ncbi:MAG: fructosamine kinase family protein [Nakamurella sp.]
MGFDSAPGFPDTGLYGGQVTDPGGDYIVKSRFGAPPGFFDWEAAGLRWLAEATATGGAAVVTIRSVSSEMIVLHRVIEAPASRIAAEAFGRALAATHAQGADAFGAGPPGWSGAGFIGRQELALQRFSKWGEFYAATRVRPYATAAHRIGNLSSAGLQTIERVCERLLAGEFDDGRPPARIHGDLWAGNVLYSPVGAVLIDPAAHGGHGLTDLAMLALFGTEYLDRVQAGYACAAELTAGWVDLLGLHQLHPLLVHAVTHGPSYGDQAARTAVRYE